MNKQQTRQSAIQLVIWRLSSIICIPVTLILLIVAIPFWVITGRFILDYRYLKLHNLAWHYRWWHKILNKRPNL